MHTIKALCFSLCVAVTTAGASAADLRMGVASEVTTLDPRFFHQTSNTMGVPPALPGRQYKINISRGAPRLSIDETPDREPPKHTHEEFHQRTSTGA